MLHQRVAQGGDFDAVLLHKFRRAPAFGFHFRAPAAHGAQRVHLAHGHHQRVERGGEPPQLEEKPLVEDQVREKKELETHGEDALVV